jgi:hypothetical protein
MSNTKWAPSPLLPLLSNGGGDVLAARDCAGLLLGEHPEPPQSLGAARLILTAVCLHLHPVAGPDPTLTDLHAFLMALARPSAEVWATLSRSSMALVQYASCDFNGGRGLRAQDALSLAIQAVEAKLHTEALLCACCTITALKVLD